VSSPAPQLRRPVQAAFSSPPPPSPGDALEDDDDVQLHDDESSSGDEAQAPCDLDDDDDDLDGFPTRAHKRVAIKAALTAANGMSSLVSTAAAPAAASDMFGPVAAAAAAQAPPLRGDSAPLDETSFPVHTEDPAVGH